MLFYHRDLHSFPTRRSSDLGLCTYQSSDGTPYVFINGKSGDIEQWRLTVQEAGIEGRIVRRLKVDSQPEGCVVYAATRSEEHTSELQSRENLVCRLLLEKKK